MNSIDCEIKLFTVTGGPTMNRMDYKNCWCRRKNEKRLLCSYNERRCCSPWARSVTGIVVSRPVFFQGPFTHTFYDSNNSPTLPITATQRYDDFHHSLFFFSWSLFLLHTRMADPSFTSVLLCTQYYPSWPSWPSKIWAADDANHAIHWSRQA